MACQIQNTEVRYSRTVYQVVTEFKIPLKAGPVKWMKNHQSVIGKKTLKQRGVDHYDKAQIDHAQ